MPKPQADADDQDQGADSNQQALDQPLLAALSRVLVIPVIARIRDCRVRVPAQAIPIGIRQFLALKWGLAFHRQAIVTGLEETGILDLVFPGLTGRWARIRNLDIPYACARFRVPDHALTRGGGSVSKEGEVATGETIRAAVPLHILIHGIDRVRQRKIRVGIAQLICLTIHRT